MKIITSIQGAGVEAGGSGVEENAPLSRLQVLRRDLTARVHQASGSGVILAPAMSAPIPEAAFRYSAFISYSHRDERWARWLHTALESYRVPSHLASAQRAMAAPRLSPVFRDRTDLPSTTDLSSTFVRRCRTRPASSSSARRD